MLWRNSKQLFVMYLVSFHINTRRYKPKKIIRRHKGERGGGGGVGGSIESLPTTFDIIHPID